MSIRFRALLSIAVLLVGTIWAAPGTTRPVAAQEASETCVNGWVNVALPSSLPTFRPNDLLAKDERPQWLLGGSNAGPVALQWRDGNWVATDTGSSDIAAFMAGALQRGSSVWTVGGARLSQPVRLEPVAGELARQRWRERPISDVPSERAVLTGVASKGTDRAWAVGTKLVNGRTKAYALRWDGSRWQERSPSNGNRDSGLTSVSSTDRGDVWAVGWAQVRSGRLRPLIAKSSATGWQTSEGAELPAGSGVLTDSHFEAGRDGWVVGYRIPEGSSQYEVILEHWDGSAWSLEPVPWGTGISAVPRSIDIDDQGGLWMAGTILADEGMAQRGFVAHRSSDGWRLYDEQFPADVTSELTAIAAVEGGAITAGVVGSTAVVLRTCEGTDVGSAIDASLGAASGAVSKDTAAADSTSTAVEKPPATIGEGKARRSGPAGRLALGRAVKPVGFSIRDVAQSSGLATVAGTIKGIAEDLDADGWTDVVYWNHLEQPHFLLGGPDGFRQGPGEAFGEADRHSCTVADVDADSMLDMFCTSGRGRGRIIGQHELLLQPGFTGGGPVADLLGIADPFGRGRIATFMQLDDDGLPDLFVSNAPDRLDGMPGTNRFYRNVGGAFVSDRRVGLDRSTGGSCAVAADIDADGDEDLLHCVDYPDDGRPQGLRVYRNDDGKLRERSRKLGLEPMKDIAVLAADMTGDGRIDVLQLNRNKILISRGTVKGFKPVFEAAVPAAEGMAIGDVNGDGALDVYVVTGTTKGNEPDFLLVNDGRGRSFSSVRIPQAQDGSGSAVMALDYDRNGLTDFVVLNGRGSFEGTTQLLASFPKPSDQ